MVGVRVCVRGRRLWQAVVMYGVGVCGVGVGGGSCTMNERNSFQPTEPFPFVSIAEKKWPTSSAAQSCASGEVGVDILRRG